MTKAQLRHLHSPDVTDLRSFAPEDPTYVGLLIQAMIGPDGEAGAESFDFFVCTPKWLADQVGENEVRSGRHHLLIGRYDFAVVEKAIQRVCKDAVGANWEVVASHLARFGKWEFEDYAEVNS
jgi:hypothetical protein